MLGEAIENAKVLDMYAGSGALGLEALSRGAKSVDFVDKHSRVAKVIEQNIDSLGINDGAQIFTRTAEQFLRHIKAEYDVILMDPPYADFDLAIVERVGNLLQYGGTMVVSTSSKAEFAAPKGLEVVRQKVYGDSMITVLHRS
jgi:16S rRNA (guanine966-N2)-methyltransferase